MLKILYIASLLICLVVIGVILSFTTPSAAGPLGILVLLIASYAFLVLLLTYSIYYLNRLILRFSLIYTPRALTSKLSIKRSYYLSTVIATVPIILTGLQSVGSVGFYELSLIVIFTTIGCFYVLKRID